MTERVMTVRMTKELAAEVEIVARLLGISTSELIRTAVAEYRTKHPQAAPTRDDSAEGREKENNDD
jgi:metal-responsive CopG/Arc/MetJ family transcriptional regulator